MYGRNLAAISPMIWIALLLNSVAGYVDTIGFISLLHIYAGNMTGNTVSLALGWAQDRWDLFFKRGMPLPSFFLGLVCSRLIILRSERAKLKWGGSITLGLEASFLLLVLLLGKSHMVQGRISENAPTLIYFVLVFLISAAMGLQNATLSHFGPLNVRTTHVTGTLTTCADELTRYFSTSERTHLRKAALYGCIWVAYLAGAIPGAFLIYSIGFSALWLPIAVLVCIAGLNLVKPMLLKDH